MVWFYSNVFDINFSGMTLSFMGDTKFSVNSTKFCGLHDQFSVMPLIKESIPLILTFILIKLVLHIFTKELDLAIKIAI